MNKTEKIAFLKKHIDKGEEHFNDLCESTFNDDMGFLKINGSKYGILKEGLSYQKFGTHDEKEIYLYDLESFTKMMQEDYFKVEYNFGYSYGNYNNYFNFYLTGYSLPSGMHHKTLDALQIQSERLQAQIENDIKEQVDGFGDHNIIDDLRQNNDIDDELGEKVDEIFQVDDFIEGVEGIVR